MTPTVSHPGSSPSLPRWKTACGGALVAIHALVIALSLAVPLVLILGSFVVEGRFTLEAVRNAFGDFPRWLGLLENTARASGIAIVLSCSLGTALGFLLFRTDARFRVLGIGAVAYLATVPLYVVQAGVLAPIGPDPVGLGVLRESWAAVGCIHGLAHLPWVVLIVGLALRSVPRDAEEAAILEGASWLRVLRSVTLPAAAGAILASALLVFLLVATDYTVSDVLRVRTFAEEVYTQFAAYGRPHEPTLSNLPLMMVLAVSLVFAGRKYLSRESVSHREMSPYVFRLGRSRTALSALTLALIGGAMLVPLVYLIRRTLEGKHGIGHYLTLFENELVTSLGTSLAAGILVSFLSVGIAWYVLRSKVWRRAIALYLVVALAFPAPLLALGLISFFNRPGIPGAIYDSPAILTLAYTLRFLPIGVLLMVPAVRAVPIETEFAAELDGCGRFDLWRKVVFPLCLPTALLVLLAVTLLSLGELPCSLLLTPPGYMTVGARFFSLIHYSLYGEAAFLSLLSSLLVAVPFLGILGAVRWSRQR